MSRGGTLAAFRLTAAAVTALVAVHAADEGARGGAANVSNASGNATGGEGRPLSHDLIGVCLSLAASTCQGLGLDGQKYAQNVINARQEAAGGEFTDTAYLCSPIWWLSFMLFMFGNVFDFVSLGFTSQSVVSLVGAWSIVVNCFGAAWILGEPITRIDYVATCLIISGGVTGIAFSGHHDEDYTSSQLLRLMTGSGFLMLVALELVATGLCVWFGSFPPVHIGYDCDEVGVPGPGEHERGGHSGGGQAEERETEERETGESLSHGHTMSLATRTFHKRVNMAKRFSFPAAAALTASVFIVISKAVSELLNASVFSGTDPFSSPVIYVLILLLILFGVYQGHLIQTSLQRNDALFHLPVFYVIWSLLSQVSAGVLTDDFRYFSHYQLMGFFFGVVLVCAGVCTVAFREQKTRLDRKSTAGGGEGGEGREDDSTELMSSQSAMPVQMKANRTSFLEVDTGMAEEEADI